MSISPIATAPRLHEAINAAQPDPTALGRDLTSRDGHDADQLREQFDTFVGEAFYGQMLKAMRQSLGKPAYFHGGRAEEIFQGQLDQLLTEEMTKSGASEFSDPLFELFSLNRQ